jgi:hypothetical protein
VCIQHLQAYVTVENEERHTQQWRLLRYVPLAGMALVELTFWKYPMKTLS